MNVKLHHVISDITGKTGMDIIEAIVAGERDPHRLAKLRNYRIRADEDTIAKSLQGHWRVEHIFELTQALELYRFYQGKIAECDREIEGPLGGFEEQQRRRGASRQQETPSEKRAPVRCPQPPVPDDGSGPDPDRRCGRLHRPQGSQRGGHRHDQMAQRQALRFLAGAESQQPHHRRADHQLPGPDQDQRQPRGGGIAYGGQWVGPVPTAPWAPSCVAKRPNWERPRPSPPPPTSWHASSIAMLRFGRDYVDAGADYYESRYRHRGLSAAKRRAAQLGYQLVPISDDQLHPDGTASASQGYAALAGGPVTW